MITRRVLGRSAAAAIALAAAPRAALAALDEADTPPNVFISPCGQPFRAHITAPYPVVDWFKNADKNGDGKLDRDEFVADAGAFFAFLDVNGDGVLDNYEISRYEHQVAPEILGMRVNIGDLRGARYYGGRFWLAQYGGGGGGDGGGGGVNDSEFGKVAPDPDTDQRPPHDIDESGQGAAPYSFFSEPEPVMAADEDLNGIIRKAAFLRLADRHFSRLDTGEAGFLTLAGLPKTQIQVRVERAQHGLHR
jgi:hypothetical protein